MIIKIKDWIIKMEYLDLKKPFAIYHIENCNLDLFASETQALINKCRKVPPRYRRYYQPFIWDANLSAIEQPFSENLEFNIDNFPFQELFSIVSSFFDEPFALTLARIFCQKSYNYAGHWHCDGGRPASFIQASLFTKKQSGFRILNYIKIQEEFPELSKDEIDQIIKLGSNEMGLKVADRYYFEISGNPGDLVVFEPSCIHQGVSRTSRADFHLRFQKISELELDHSWSENVGVSKWGDMNFLDVFAPGATEEVGSLLPSHEVGLKEQLKTTLRYGFPRRAQTTIKGAESNLVNKITQRYRCLFLASEFRNSFFQVR